MVKIRSLPISRFKAQCLALLEEVKQTGAEIIVTKRGKPMAKVVPYDGDAAASLRGSVAWYGDIVSPTGERWEADQE